MKGYKAFNKDLKCFNDFQFEVGKTYEHNGEIEPCKSGFHFCKTVADCYTFYEKHENTRICKIEAIGEVKTDDNVKFCTDKITILKEIKNPRKKSNLSKSNSGYCNSGEYNTGNYNTGYWNSGDCNSGDCNSGNCNSGNRNTGNWNSGNWNSGNWNSGVFNTDKNPKIKMFDKESDWTMNDWRASDARKVMSYCPYSCSTFIGAYNMTDEEKEKHPEHKTIGGYVKVITVTDEDKQKWWDGLSEASKKSVMELPNFDADKFKKCTGIQV